VPVLAVLSAAAAAGSDHAAWLGKVEGFYVSRSSPTPFGALDFAMDMIKQPDGAVHGRSWVDKETYFDFKFYRGEQGQLLFQETGSLPGGFVQSYVLEVVKAAGDTLTFETKKQPGLLVAQVTADGDRLRVQVTLRSKPHVDLDMARVRDEKAITAFRAANARNKDQPAGSALKQSHAARASEGVDGNLPKTEQAGCTWRSPGGLRCSLPARRPRTRRAWPSR